MKGVIERDLGTYEGQVAESYQKYNLVISNHLVFNPMDLISGWVDIPNTEGLISPSYRVLEKKDKELNLDFFKYYFQTLYKEKILFYFGEGVHYEYRWGLGSDTLMNFPIPVPSILEQQQIVSFLDHKTHSINLLIEKIEKKIQLLNEQRTSLINKCVTKGLDPNVEMKESGIEWIGDIPSHWEMKKLKYLFSLIGGKDPKKIQNYEGNYPILGTGGEIDRGDDYLYDQKTLLLGRKGTIDRPFLFNGPFWVSDVMYYTVQKTDMTPDYISYLFKTFPFDYYVYGSTQPSMSRLDYEQHFFSVPPNNEQEDILKFLHKKTKIINESI